VYGTEGALAWNFERMNELELARGRGSHSGFTTIYAGPGFGDFDRFQPGAGTGMGYDDLKVIEARRFLGAVLARRAATVAIAPGPPGAPGAAGASAATGTPGATESPGALAAPAASTAEPGDPGEVPGCPAGPTIDDALAAARVVAAAEASAASRHWVRVTLHDNTGAEIPA
jgi:predicted dehydrogenase